MGRLFVCTELVTAVKALGYVAHGSHGDSERIHLKYTGGGGSTEGLTRPSTPSTNGFAGEKYVQRASEHSKTLNIVVRYLFTWAT